MKQAIAGSIKFLSAQEFSCRFPCDTDWIGAMGPRSVPVYEKLRCSVIGLRRKRCSQGNANVLIPRTAFTWRYT